jgi:hypothetical protein
MNRHRFVILASIILVGGAPLSACHVRTVSIGDTSPSIPNEKAPEPPPYERNAFGSGWEDKDGDCKNTRMELLARLTLSPVSYDSEGCRVVSGRWMSEYTGHEIYNAANIDIDHVVPLAYAWKLGAFSWTNKEREAFANDESNLRPVEASVNRSKGDSPPSEWLPEINQCSYVSRFYRVVKTYQLELPAAELSYVGAKLEHCRAAD